MFPMSSRCRASAPDRSRVRALARGATVSASPREEPAMGHPVVHFEIIGKDGDALRSYYSTLFGWDIDASNEMGYGIVPREQNLTKDGVGIGGGVAAGPGGYGGALTGFRGGAGGGGARGPGGARRGAPGGGAGGGR